MILGSGSSPVYLIAILIVLLGLIAFASWLARRRFAKLDTQHFSERWLAIQQLCKQEATWPLAVIDGDKLLDEALKKCHYKGKTMGGRLVAAQRELSDNDGAWFGHKLRNKLVHEDYSKLNKRIVLAALSGFRQALRDLGALR